MRASRGEIDFQQTGRTARRHLQAADLGLYEHFTSQIMLGITVTANARNLMEFNEILGELFDVHDCRLVSAH